MTNKFEIGSQWKTRGGWRAVVVSHYANSMMVWHDMGRLPLDRTQEHKLCGIGIDVKPAYVSTIDLMTPWIEPRIGRVLG